jgi:hypothetical protein
MLVSGHEHSHPSHHARIQPTGVIGGHRGLDPVATQITRHQLGVERRAGIPNGSRVSSYTGWSEPQQPAEPARLLGRLPLGQRVAMRVIAHPATMTARAVAGYLTLVVNGSLSVQLPRLLIVRMLVTVPVALRPWKWPLILTTSPLPSPKFLLAVPRNRPEVIGNVL